jgi:GTP pyrophosphokinase
MPDAAGLDRLPSEAALGERFKDALGYATGLHARDVRKSTAIPYVGHLLGVCALVIENGGNETESIAALLHDAAEDHGGTDRLDDIRRRFGAEVARIVERCSDSLTADPSKKAPWLERKRSHVARIEAHASEGDASTLLVTAADKLYNLRSIATDLDDDAVGERVYGRFHGGKWGTLWYYRVLADVLCRYPGRHRRIARELEALATRLCAGQSAAQLLARYDRENAR